MQEEDPASTAPPQREQDTARKEEGTCEENQPKGLPRGDAQSPPLPDHHFRVPGSLTVDQQFL